MSESLLQQGIAALKTGHKSKARCLLEQLVQSDPGSEHGWLWLSGAVDTDEQRRFCLLQVLSINRRNVLASRGLEKLGPGDARSPLGENRNSSMVSSSQRVKQSDSDVNCPSCGAINPHTNRFCDQCGASLDTRTEIKPSFAPVDARSESPRPPERKRPTTFQTVLLSSLGILILLGCIAFLAIMARSYFGLGFSNSQQVVTLAPATVNTISPTPPLPTRMKLVDGRAEQFPLSLYFECPYKPSSGQGWVTNSCRVAIVNESGTSYDNAGTLLIYRGYVDTEEGRRYDCNGFDICFHGNCQDATETAIPLDMFHYEYEHQEIPPFLPAQRFTFSVRWAQAATPTRFVLETTQGTWEVDLNGEHPVYLPSPSVTNAEDFPLTIRQTGSTKIEVELNTSCTLLGTSSSASGYHLEYHFEATNIDRLDGAHATIEVGLPYNTFVFVNDEYYGQPVLLEAHSDPLEIALGPGQSMDGQISIHARYRLDHFPDYVLTKSTDGSYRFYRLPPPCR